MEEEKRRELRHILISYIPYGDLEYEVKDYENIINFIANYFKEKDYQYVIGRDTVINQKLKEKCIPISVIQNKIRPVIDELEKDGFVGYADELRDILDEVIEGNK